MIEGIYGFFRANSFGLPTRQERNVQSIAGKDVWHRKDTTAFQTEEILAGISCKFTCHDQTSSHSRCCQGDNMAMMTHPICVAQNILGIRGRRSLFQILLVVLLQNFLQLYFLPTGVTLPGCRCHTGSSETFRYFSCHGLKALRIVIIEILEFWLLCSTQHYLIKLWLPTLISTIVYFTYIERWAVWSRRFKLMRWNAQHATSGSDRSDWPVHLVLVDRWGTIGGKENFHIFDHNFQASSLQPTQVLADLDLSGWSLLRTGFEHRGHVLRRKYILTGESKSEDFRATFAFRYFFLWLCLHSLMFWKSPHTRRSRRWWW